MKRAAIIGLGDISFVHLDAIADNPEIELVAACDLRESQRHNVADSVAFYTDYKKLWEEVKPDVVHICLPHYLHFPVSKFFVEHGVNVFCEKPVALTTAQAEEFAALEQAHPEVKIGICLQNRLNTSTVLLKSLLDSGEYGNIIGCRGFVPWYRPEKYYTDKPWRGQMEFAGGGSMINQSVHTLDLLYYLCGDITALHGTISTISDYDIDVEDNVTARLEFKNGARGLFFATNNDYANESVQIKVVTDKAQFLIENNALYRLGDGGAREVLCQDPVMSGIKFYYGKSHSNLIAKFYRAVETGGDDYIHVRDAVMSIRLIDAIRRSSAEDARIELN